MLETKGRWTGWHPCTGDSADATDADADDDADAHADDDAADALLESNILKTL